MIRAIIFVGMLSCSTVVASEPPPTTTEKTAIIERLDSILKRLEAIEQRLDVVEFIAIERSPWTVDRYGVMRSPAGRPIGFWGIDGPNTMYGH